MEKYEVNKGSFNTNYGIYSYCRKDCDIKNLGMITDKKYVFNIGISDCYARHVDYTSRYGDYNLWINMILNDDVFELDVNYKDTRSDTEKQCGYPKKALTQFHYDCLLGLINECKKVYFDMNREVLIYLDRNVIPAISKEIYANITKKQINRFDICCDYDKLIEIINIERDKVVEEEKEKTNPGFVKTLFRKFKR